MLSFQQHHPCLSSNREVDWNQSQRMDFCDPQGGKGAADRMAATAKNHIRIFINKGNDVTTAQQMKDALLSHGGIKGVRVAVADQLEEISIEQPKIQGTEANIIPT